MNKLSQLTEEYVRSEQVLDERIKKLLKENKENPFKVATDFENRIRLLRAERYALRKIIAYLKNYYRIRSNPSIKISQGQALQKEAEHHK